MTFNLRGGKSDAGDRAWRMRHYVQRHIVRSHNMPPTQSARSPGKRT
ncbi:hypothetical protein [Microcoleus vaginatus]